MPNIGEVKRASEIGHTGRALFVWSACPDCGKTRWMYKSQQTTRCWSCAATKRARDKQPLTYFGVGSPKIGDIATAKSLGYVDRGIRTFGACPDCNKGHWLRNQDKGKRCPSCAGKYNGLAHRLNNHPRWNKGIMTKRGYVFVHMSKDDPLFSMSNSSSCVLEHRLVVARRIGRPLRKGEIIHHINGIKSDNRDSNLLLLNERDHNSHLVARDIQKRVQELESRMILVETENTLLRKVLEEIRDSVPDSNLILQHYNTLGGLEMTEGIVQSPSNGRN